MAIKVPNPAKRGKLVKIKDEVEFFDHQAKGTRWHSRTLGSCVADDQGLGKSIMGLTRLAVHWEQHQARSPRYIIVTLASLKMNIAEEIDEKTNFTYVVLDGTPKKRAKMLAEFADDILIVNYEQVKIHLDELDAMGFSIALFDEAHLLSFVPPGRRAGKDGKVRKASSARADACNRLQVEMSYPMTGSVVTGQIDDLWAIMNRIAPKQFPSYWAFVQRYGVFTESERHERTNEVDDLGSPIYKVRKYRTLSGVKNAEELRNKIAPYFLRREKSECLDLPDKLPIPIVLPMNKTQAEIYKQAKDEMRLENPGNDPMEIDNALTKLLRLHQISSSPACIDGMDFPDDSAKLDWVVEQLVIHQGAGHPVVVWSKFRTIIPLLVRRLADVGITPWQLHGGVHKNARTGLINDWSADCRAGHTAPMIATIQAAGVGLNMQVASREIFIDKLYVPKLNEQAEDRLHRIGQTETVQVWDLRCKGTIEKRINEILEQKRDVFNAVTDPRDPAWKKRLIAEYLAGDDDE